MRGFTKTGQPIIGRRYIVRQGDDFEQEITVVGKLYGPGGNADLIGIIADDGEGRGSLPWPLEALPDTPPIEVVAK